MIARVRKYPAAAAGALQAIVALALVLAGNVTAEQSAAILGALAAVLALFVHTQVTPVAPADRGL